MDEEFSEAKIVYEATMGALTGVRRILILISGLLGLFLFNLFLFYLCWDHARIAARNGIISTLQQSQEDQRPYLNSAQEDKELLEQTRTEIANINQALATKTYEVPLVGMPVASSDFSIAILLLATALLLWLLFFQRRFGACLKQLAKLKGGGVVVSALQYHFLLIGSHASSKERRAAQGLIYGIPIVGSLQFFSDLADLFSWLSGKVTRLAFNNNVFVVRTLIRLALDLGLVLALAFLAYRCFGEYKKIEEELTQHLA